jgi:two-component system, OmpR family, alkaline phosphatase synthesis response regulator PhoP
VKRILLVDDDRDVVRSTAQLLQAFGYKVTVCVDADRVVEMMHSQRPDVVLHDVRMPGLDLKAQVRAIRDDPKIARVPIVLFTAVLSARELAQEVGADDAIQKPFDSETLRRVLRDCEARQRGVNLRLIEHEKA